MSLLIPSQKSLDLYIRTYVDSSAFDAVVLPSLEKALNRGLVPGEFPS